MVEFKRWIVITGFILVPSVALAASNEQQEPVGLGPRLLANSEYDWLTLEGDDLQLHVKRGSFASRHRMVLLHSARAVLQNGLARLGEARYSHSIQVFYLDSREEMKTVVGVGATGYADIASNSVFLVFTSDWRTFDQHEIFHILTLGLWGSPADPGVWIREGSAVHVDGFCGEHRVDAAARALLLRDELPAMRQVIADFFEYPDLVAYLAAGSFVGYIWDRFGTGTLRGLWRSGVTEFDTVVGRSLEEVEKAWREHLRSWTPEEGDLDLEKLDEIGCG